MVTKYIAPFFVIILLVVGIGVGTYLIQSPQDFREKANFQASEASLSFTPVSGFYEKDTLLKIIVFAESKGDLIHVVQANVMYPTNKMEFVDISTKDSVLISFTKKEESNGVVSISGESSLAGFSGNKLIATIAFKVISDTGTAALSFAPDSFILRSSDNSDIFVGSGTAQLTLGKAPSDVKTVSQSPKSNSPSLNNLTISSVSVNEITRSTASITWQTDILSSSEIEFGLDSDYGLTASSPELTTNHSVLIENDLQPGTTYHFRIKGKSSDSFFKTKGYDVIVRVKDALGNPIPGATVSIYSDTQTTQTEASGEAHFSDMSLGKHGIIVKQNNQTIIDEVTVTEGELPLQFEVSFSSPSLTSSTSASFPILYTFVAFLIFLIIAIIVYTLLREKKASSITISQGYSL